MAMAKCCDACGGFYKYIKNETKPNGIAVAFFDNASKMQNVTQQFELCPDCLQAVHDTIASRAKNNEEDE